MAREILIIVDKFALPSGELVFGLTTGRDELRDAWVNTTIEDLASSFKSKQIKVIGKDYEFTIRIIDAEVLNSVADFKNVYIRLPSSPKTNKIALLDEIEIEL
jgi:TRAP-type C4-dicarboxylate transport system substrate-binding protein